MQMYFSKLTSGFYSDAVHKQMPADIVAITEAKYQALMAAQSSGQMIQADANGNPVAVAFAPTAAQAQASLVAQAQAALTKSDITLVRCLEHGITPPAAWVSYRAELRQVINGTLTIMPTQPSYPSGS
jgi:hypothetical protein